VTPEREKAVLAWDPRGPECAASVPARAARRCVCGGTELGLGGPTRRAHGEGTVWRFGWCVGAWDLAARAAMIWQVGGMERHGAKGSHRLPRAHRAQVGALLHLVPPTIAASRFRVTGHEHDALCSYWSWSVGSTVGVQANNAMGLCGLRKSH
jgi:hypothetical protein